MNPRLLVVAAALLVLPALLPGAAAQAPVPRFAGLVLTESLDGSAWTLEETVILVPRNGTAVEAAAPLVLWVPVGATVHQVTVDGNATPWFRENASAIRLAHEGPLHNYGALFTLPGGALPPLAFPVRAQENAVEVRAVPGHLPESGGLQFADTGTTVAGRSVWEARPQAVAPFGAYALSVAAPEGPPAPVWPFALAALAALVLLFGLYVARRRGLAARAKDPMTLMGHLRELSSRLVTIIIAIAFFLIAFFSFGLVAGTVGGFEVYYPVPSVEASVGAQAFRYVADRFIPEGVTLIVTGPGDAIMAQFEVTLMLAFIAATPVIAYEVGAFLAPALLENEKRYVVRIVPAVAGLFLLGAAFAFFFMVPFMMGTLYEFAPTLGAVPFITADGLIGFTVWTTLLFGLCFELPVIMAALTAFGLVKPATWAQKWRHAVVAILILSGIVTPDPTIISQLVVSAPLLILYAAGVIVSYAVARNRAKRTGTVS
ncbi:MAG TPA: twin-arginine translocase subunit TatC [Candidatus Thermoplasmatota archaeon]|nr:twin-arginine translocase subunit TatC [Candidatus Thermoplasmatota archaeon]